MATPFFFQVLALSQALNDVIGHDPTSAEAAAQSALFLAGTMANKGVPLPSDARRRCLNELCALAKSVHISIDDVGMGVFEAALETLEDIFLERQYLSPESKTMGQQTTTSIGAYRGRTLVPWKG